MTVIYSFGGMMRFNKYIFLFLFIAAAVYVQAQQTEDYNGFTINEIEVSSNRIKPEVLKNYFPLKQGDSFSQEKYLHAQNELHDLRIAKNLDFTLIPKQNNKLDISIKADDGYYVFPLFFITGGSNSAAGLALATGNLFKRGETLMFFGGAGQNGEMASIMLKEGKNIYNAFFSNMNFDQRFYKGGWINNTSVFNTGDDEKDFKNPLSTFYTKKDVFNFTYARKAGYFLFSLTPQYEYILYSADLPSGNYNNITFAVKFSKNIRSGANMGALFGYGLTDKEQSLKDLSAPILGYGAQVAYQNGGKWSGADFNISKLSLHLQSITELKTRHLFNVQLKAQDSFSTPFAQQVRSDDLLSAQGRYSRILYGQRGAGISTSFTYYLIRNNTGLLSLQPFYELAYLYNKGYKHHSGTGASLFYKFWRFPFPVGINYTYNLSDYSNQVSFVLGGSF